MTYQQINSTFIPKSSDIPQALDSAVTLDDNLALIEENEDLLSKVKTYENKINELEEIISSKDEKINAYSAVITALEEEIKELKEAESKNDFLSVDVLNVELLKLKEENLQLQSELTSQKEHAQLLHILMLVLVIV